MTSYYAFANNTALIKRKSLRQMIYDLTHYYKNIGDVKIVNDSGELIRTMTLVGKRCVEDNIPNSRLLSAVNQTRNDGFSRVVLTPRPTGNTDPPKICY